MSAWVTKVDTSPTATTVIVHVTVANHSDEPVWECVSLIVRRGTEDRSGMNAALDHGVLAPGEERPETVTVRAVPEWQASEVRPNDLPRVILSFVDSSRRGWTRAIDGAL